MNDHDDNHNPSSNPNQLTPATPDQVHIAMDLVTHDSSKPITAVVILYEPAEAFSSGLLIPCDGEASAASVIAKAREKQGSASMAIFPARVSYGRG